MRRVLDEAPEAEARLGFPYFTRDWKEIFDVGPTIEDGELAGNRPQWPADLPAFRAPIERLYAAFEQLARRLATTTPRCRCIAMARGTWCSRAPIRC